MDLALQLSQQEASVTALQLQRREEEDVMKAIEESVSTDLSQLELNSPWVTSTCSSPESKIGSTQSVSIVTI